jgi:hypothetical protein
LGAFVASAEQNDEFITPLAEIDTIAGAIIDSHFGEATTCMFHISKISIACPPNPVSDLCRRLAISQSIEPIGKLNRLPNLEELSFI